MKAGMSLSRQARARHRHELRTLTYVTLDRVNGGVVRNLTHDGISVQTVVPVLPRQQLRLRLDLRYPRLRVETRGEVVWSTFSGQCGIRFLDLPPRMARQIDEWIFGDLLDGIAARAVPDGPVFAGAAAPAEQEDGLMISTAPTKVIPLPVRPAATYTSETAPNRGQEELDWLSQPLSGRSLVWTIHSLIVLAGLLLFSLIFLSITGEPPEWPLAMVAGATVCVTVLYWGFFKAFGGDTAGERLARMAGGEFGEDPEISDSRFR